MDNRVMIILSYICICIYIVNIKGTADFLYCLAIYKNMNTLKEKVFILQASNQMNNPQLDRKVNVTIKIHIIGIYI